MEVVGCNEKLGMAEGEGFEPSVHFRVRHISNVLV